MSSIELRSLKGFKRLKADNQVDRCNYIVTCDRDEDLISLEDKEIKVIVPLKGLEKILEKTKK